jgi:serine/threonine protein kinase
LTPLQRREFARKIAAMLAAMHNNKITHRDTKATNFLVQEKNGLQIVCVDMDGIKPMNFFSHSRIMQPLCRLGAALMGTRNVRRTDFLRVFTAYCDLTGIDKNIRRRLYSELAAKARKKFKKKQAFWRALGINLDRTQPL